MVVFETAVKLSTEERLNCFREIPGDDGDLQIICQDRTVWTWKTLMLGSDLIKDLCAEMYIPFVNQTIAVSMPDFHSDVVKAYMDLLLTGEVCKN